MGEPDHDTLEVYVVDDDIVIRQMIEVLLSRAGYSVTCFADGPTLLRAIKEKSPACILLDINLPHRSGLEILDDLRASCCAAPVVMVSGRGELSIAVNALKRGASDYIEKPFHGDTLIACLKEVISNTHEIDTKPVALANFSGFPSLTKRERDILEQCIKGATTKEAAHNLNLSPRTIEDHRSNIMKKLGAKNTADVIRIALTLGV